MNTPPLVFTVTVILLLFPLPAKAGISGIFPDEIDTSFSNESGKVVILSPKEQEWLITPKVTTGMMYLKFEKSDAKTKWSDISPFIGVGLTAHRWGLFGEIYLQKSDKGQDDNYNELERYFLRFLTSKDADFKRVDYSLLAGCDIYEVLGHFSTLAGYKGLFKGLSASVGYKRSGLEIHTIETQSIQMNSALTSFITSTNKTRFTTAGPSVGIAYNFNFNENMNFGISTAYGWLEGDYESTTTIGNKQTRSQLDPQATTGAAVGINFSHRLPRYNLKYLLSLDSYKYKMDVKESYTIQGIKNTNAYFVKEKSINFKATLLWEFF